MGCKPSSAPPEPEVKILQPAKAARRSLCPRGSTCPCGDAQHYLLFCHPGDVDWELELRARATSRGSRAVSALHDHSSSSPGLEPPAPSAPSASSSGPRQACKFGLRCWRTAPEHAELFAHPGDPDYRKGIVRFNNGGKPEFATLRQLFDFCDPKKHGNFTSKQELQEAFVLLRECCPDAPASFDCAWREMDGERDAHVGFAKFAAWVQEKGCLFPIGVELTHAGSQSNGLSCGFTLPGGTRCGCRHFVAAVDSQTTNTAAQRCKCGHRRSLHALRLEDDTHELREGLAPVPSYWRPRDQRAALEEQFVLLEADAVARFQFLFDVTHKSTDNWTRDRGCSLHDLACSAECAFKFQKPVPTGYKIEAVLRNTRAELWGLYAVHRAAIAQECEDNGRGRAFKAFTDVKTVNVLLEDAPLVESCNEWFLLHGTAPDRCRSICESGFTLSRAGTGATWKEAGASKGTPLYGFGLYFAESITKADEYSKAVPKGEMLEGCHVVLVCRVTGGRAQYCDTNEIDAAVLQRQVIAGPFHSVFGDRVTRLKKPYREVVVYDATQCYPEYLVYYTRLYS